MSNERKIKVLHIEPTDVCQAACPLCARETNKNFNKDSRHHLTMNQITSIFDQNKIADLDKMFMCGNYGDPAAGQHTLDIFRGFRSIHSTIVLGMNSNGALQNQHWWHTLALILNQPRDYVVFSIDGLEDTNHIYRRNVSWKKLMDNVTEFINSGGSAHWDMLVYQHNEHQIDQCKQLAKDLGFKWFRAKVSKRPFINGLTSPVHFDPPVVHQAGNIECHALNEHSMYIDARGKQHPCCWLGNNLNNAISEISEVSSTWHSNIPNPICRKTCSKIDNQTVFSTQWKIEEAL
jgi:hypothetical protein